MNSQFTPAANSGHSQPVQFNETANAKAHLMSPRIPESAEIIRRIQTACVNRPVDEATVAISFPGGSRSYFLDKDRRVSEIFGEESLRLPAACMTKLHTATVAIEKLAEVGISIDAGVKEIFEDLFGMKSLSPFAGITIRHLLNSSHGVDNPSYDSFETKDGYVDFERQYSRFTAVPPLHDPGTVFSFSDVGMLLIGAILERSTQRRYGQLLKESLLPKLWAKHAARLGGTGSYRGGADDKFVCPTAGGDLTISAADLLDLADLYMDSQSPEAKILLNAMRERPVGFAGWTGMGTKVGLGWHCYPGEWWGYNGATANGGSLLLRMQPESGVAIAIISKQMPAHYLAMSTFSDLLPEAKMIRPPKLLPPAEVSVLQVGDWQGRYEVACLAIDMRQTGDHQLDLTIKHRSEMNHGPLEAPIARGTRFAENRTFYTVPAELKFLSVGQIVDLPMRDRQQRFIWNGRRLWRKTA